MMYILLAPLALYGALAIASLLYALWHVPFATRRAFGDFWLGVRLSMKWFALLWIGFTVELIGTAIAPVLVLFANHATGRLPVGFQWMETQDALLPGYPVEQAFTNPPPATWWDYYWQSLCWLWRNRTYRFAAEVLGVLCVNGEPRQLYGIADVSDEPPVVLGSFVEVSRTCFECHRVFAAFGRYWEWRIGYKMRWTRGTTAYAQHVMRLRSGSTI
jgi:hypothetical protein